MVLVIQDKAPREKACIYGRSMTHALLSEFADKQKWAWKAEASGFPLPKQLTLSLQKDISISWREAMSLTDPVFCKPNMKQEGRDRKEQKMKAAFEAFRPFFLALKSW